MTQYTHIRNATGKLTIKNTTFLIDPFLAPKDTYLVLKEHLTINKECLWLIYLYQWTNY